MFKLPHHTHTFTFPKHLMVDVNTRCQYLTSFSLQQVFNCVGKLRDITILNISSHITFFFGMQIYISILERCKQLLVLKRLQPPSSYPSTPHQYYINSKEGITLTFEKIKVNKIGNEYSNCTHKINRNSCISLLQPDEIRLQSSLLSSGIMYSRLQRMTIPDAVIIQFFLLNMGMLMLGTCRGL